jgi:hypothetical protein
MGSFNNYGFKQFGNLSQTAEGTVSDNSPYLKYQWIASFVLDEQEDISSSFTLKTFELPRWTIDSQVVNQYNHKSVIQTKMNFEPITISFYDQQNDKVEEFISNAVKGQFDATDGSKNLNHTPMTVKLLMHQTSGGSLIDPSSDGDDDAEIIDAAKEYTLYNAYVVDAQHDTVDYSSSDVVLWTLTIRYEFMSWHKTATANFSNVDIQKPGNYIRKFDPDKAPEATKTPEPNETQSNIITGRTTRTKATVIRKNADGTETVAQAESIVSTNKLDKKPADKTDPALGIAMEQVISTNGQRIINAVNKNKKIPLSPTESREIVKIVQQTDEQHGPGKLAAFKKNASKEQLKALRVLNLSRNKDLRKSIQNSDNIVRSSIGKGT